MARSTRIGAADSYCIIALHADPNYSKLSWWLLGVTVRSVRFVGCVLVLHGGELANLLAYIPPLLLALRPFPSLPQFCCRLSWRLHDEAHLNSHQGFQTGSNELMIVTDRQISHWLNAEVTVIGRAIFVVYVFYPL